MNEQVLALLTQLAEKLGTTVEHLWSVLVKQAFISTTVNLLIYSLLLILGFVLSRTHKKFCGAMPKYQETTYYHKYGAYSVLMVVAFVVWAIIIIVFTLCLPEILSGYFNPEYWALSEILSALKCSH